MSKIGCAYNQVSVTVESNTRWAYLPHRNRICVAVAQTHTPTRTATPFAGRSKIQFTSGGDKKSVPRYITTRNELTFHAETSAWT